MSLFGCAVLLPPQYTISPPPSTFVSSTGPCCSSPHLKQTTSFQTTTTRQTRQHRLHKPAAPIPLIHILSLWLPIIPLRTIPLLRWTIPSWCPILWSPPLQPIFHRRSGCIISITLRRGVVTRRRVAVSLVWGCAVVIALWRGSSVCSLWACDGASTTVAGWAKAETVCHFGRCVLESTRVVCGKRFRRGENVLFNKEGDSCVLRGDAVISLSWARC
jgi:hypothetical protein